MLLEVIAVRGITVIGMLLRYKIAESPRDRMVVVGNRHLPLGLIGFVAGCYGVGNGRFEVLFTVSADLFLIVNRGRCSFGKGESGAEIGTAFD